MIALIKKKLVSSLIDKVDRCIADINALNGKRLIQLVHYGENTHEVIYYYDNHAHQSVYLTNNFKQIAQLKDLYKDLKEWRKVLIAKCANCKYTDKENNNGNK